MEKIEFKKDYKALYTAPQKSCVLVEVPSMQYLMVDGMGDPNTAPEFHSGVAALYEIAYTVKFAAKKAGIGPEYSVAPLEGLWWCEGTEDFDVEHRELWQWRLQIPQPPHVDAGMVRAAVQDLRKKGKESRLEDVRLETFEEGLCVQTLHIGPFNTESPAVEAMHKFVADSGLSLRGKHHEIYMSDFRRTAPEKLKTILRQPVSKS